MYNKKVALKLGAAVMLSSIMLTSCSNGDSSGQSKLSSATIEPVATDAQESEEITQEMIDAAIEEALAEVETEETEAPVVISEDADAAEGVDINITEKMYVTYINEIYTNTEDYLGKTIQIEGMYTTEYYDVTQKDYYYVYRQGPGCCGNDGSMCGFEFTWADGTPVETPAENDWIQVIGVLEQYEEEGTTYLTLTAKSVTVMEERGAETVSS